MWMDPLSRGEHVGCGGVLRDASGCWRGGFVRNLGTCSVLAAELWGILSGLQLLAWEGGWKKIIVESDSSVAVAMVQEGVPQVHHCWIELPVGKRLVCQSGSHSEGGE